MVDVGIQSETEDLSDIEAGVQGTAADRKPSLLQVVPEEEHEDCELVTKHIYNTFVISIYLRFIRQCTLYE